MRIKKYEKFTLVLFVSVFIFVTEVIFGIYLISTKEYKYDKIEGVVVKDNLLDIVISKEQRNVMYKNNYLHMNDRKIRYKIEEERTNIYKHNGRNYYELLISYKFDKKHKSSDIISISIKREKYRLIEIFKLIWDGD